MDPNTTLALMRDAQERRSWLEADAHAADLGAWLAGGGFQPADATRAELDHARRAYSAELAERHGWAA